MINIGDCFKDEENLKKFIEFALEQDKIKEQKRIAFIKEKQDSVMEKIYNFLKNNDLIDNEDMVYLPDNYEFSLEEFSMLFDNVSDYAHKLNKESIEEDNIFPNFNFFLKYKDMNILLRIMWGQGVCQQMRVDLPAQWNENKSITYEEYKEHILKE